MGAGEIQTTEGTTQDDTLAMAFYGISTTLLISKLDYLHTSDKRHLGEAIGTEDFNLRLRKNMYEFFVGGGTSGWVVRESSNPQIVPSHPTRALVHTCTQTPANTCTQTHLFPNTHTSNK